MNRLIFFALTYTCFIAFKAEAQTPAWAWAKGETGSAYADNTGLKIKVGASGNVYVLGNFDDDSVKFENTTLYNQQLCLPTGDNFFILKYTPQGNLLFAKNIGKGEFQGFGFDLDALENIYVSGTFYQDSASIGANILYNKNWNTSYSQHIFIAKFDSAVNPLWVRSNSSTGIFTSYSLDVDLSGNIYVFGDCGAADLIKFDSTSVAINDSISYLFIVKFNSSGKVIWIKTAGGNKQGIIHAGAPVANDITIDKHDNFFITGRFDTPYLVFDSITIYNYKPKWDDMFLAKYDSSGRVLWAKSEGGNSQNGVWGKRVGTDADGNVYVAGGFSPNSIFSSQNVSGRGGYLVQYDQNGKLNWIKTINLNGHTGGGTYGLSIDAFGNEYVSGDLEGDSSSASFDSININNSDFYSYYYVFAAKYNSLGNIQWVKEGINGYGQDICADNFGNVYTTGFFDRDTLVLDSISLMNSNTLAAFKTFTAKIGALITMVDEHDGNKYPITIYPDPLHISATLVLPDSRLNNCYILIYNSLGKKVRKEVINNLSTTIYRNSLPAGIYFYQLINENNQIASGKFVIE